MTTLLRPVELRIIQDFYFGLTKEKVQRIVTSSSSVHERATFSLPFHMDQRDAKKCVLRIAIELIILIIKNSIC